MKFQTNGFDELKQRLGGMQKGAEELAGTDEDLFPIEFMKEYTEFRSIDDFFYRSPFDVKSQEDLEEIDERKLDSFVCSTTQFKK